MSIESEMKKQDQEQVFSEKQIEDTLRSIMDEASKRTEGITIWAGQKWKEGFELLFLAKAVAEHGVDVPDKRMSRKAKKRAWGTISYRKKHHPDFGCPLSRKNLIRINEEAYQEDLGC